jgi:hypothetical protein
MTRLIAIEDVKPLLPIRSGNSSYDAQIDGFILAVSRMIETECRTTFKRGVREEFHTARTTYARSFNLYGDGEAYTLGANEQIIPLRAAPVDPLSPITIWYDPYRQFGEDTLIEERSYTLDEELSRIFLRYPTNHNRAALKVRYTAGYAEADGSLSEALKEQAPDLFQAAVQGVMHMWNGAHAESVDAEAKSSGTKQQGSAGLPKQTLHLLAPYRRVLTGRS